MKISLVNLPWRSFGREGVRAGSRWPHLKARSEKEYLPFPFFLAYAAALLKKNGFNARLIDAIASGLSYRRFSRRMRSSRPDILVCETSTVTLKHDLRVLKGLGSKAEIILCGPDVNIRRPDFLRENGFIKYVLSGEYEFTLLELLQHLDEGRGLDEVKGIIYRSNGGVKINPARPLVDLDRLPWPLREGLPMSRYNDAPGDIPIPSVQMMASRGCPFRCKFCLWPQVMYQGSHYRARSVVDVVDEMEYLVRNSGYRSVYFDDDTFNCGKERMLGLCAEIKKRGLNIFWAIMARADLMDEEILVNMKEAGLFAVKYGVESADNSLLDNINKGMSLEKTEAVIKMTRALGIKTHLTFTLGLPGETRQTIKKTVDFALKADPESLQFSLATPFPGTEFYREMKENGRIISADWARYDGSRSSALAYDDLSAGELERAMRSAYRRWAMHRLKRARFDRLGLKAYCRYSLVNSINSNGIVMTAYKVSRFAFRYALMHVREALVSSPRKIENIAREKGLKLGRMSLVPDGRGLSLFWGGLKLTRGRGFYSFLNFEGADNGSDGALKWDTQRPDAGSIILRRLYDGAGIEEIWKITALDEKQIGWDVDIEIKKETGVRQEDIGLALTRKYRKWIEEWGEGRFPPLNDYREVELRNARSAVVGVRGRRALRNTLPTVLLDLSAGNNGFLPSVGNSAEGHHGRLLGVRLARGARVRRYAAGRHRLLSARIKIVEEDFAKGGRR
ncbi:MAG: radical SAM protein [Candidatus Omnitrophica bacterium]|nr:radical SAM protein [Candidatus Omnitrophota bacterium]